jgi:hypothetical protein
VLTVELPQCRSSSLVGILLPGKSDGGIVEENIQFVVLVVYLLGRGFDGLIVIDVDLDRLQIFAVNLNGVIGYEGFDGFLSLQSEETWSQPCVSDIALGSVFRCRTLLKSRLPSSTWYLPSAASCCAV